MVDFDRRETQAREPRRLARLADESRQGGARVAETAQVDSRQNDFFVTLSYATADLAQHCLGAAATRGAADERDHAEVAGEAAAVLDLHEGAYALEPRRALHAGDRADVAGDRGRRVLAPALDDGDMPRQARECVALQVRTAPRHVDPRVRACSARRGAPRLGHRLVRDAAGVDDRDVGRAVALLVTVGEQTLAYGLRIEVRHLAAQKTDREARHAAGLYCASSSKSAAQPSSVRRATRRYGPNAGSSRSR